MSGAPDAGGSYVRQPDGSLVRMERTVGPNDLPDAETPDTPLPPAPAEPEEGELMPAPLKWRRKVALAKLESTYATDSAPTGAANAMLLSNVEIRPMEGEDTTREIEWPHLGAQPQIPTGLRATLTGSIELVGSGTEGVAPAWGPLLRACGCAQVITPDTSVAYTPISTEMESVTIHFWIDGIRHVLRGARGTVEIGINAQSVPSARFTMTGLWSKPTDTAPATPNFTAFRAPLVATMAHTPTFQVAGTPLVLRSFGFNMGNSVEPRLLIGREEILITDRQELISATVEAVPLATLDPFDLAQDQNNTFAVTITHGITAGFRTTIAAPRCQMMRLEGYENNQNVLEWPLHMRPLFNSGNDQFSITSTEAGMFKLSTDPQFTHRVSVSTPVDGGHETETMQVRYRVVPVAEVADFDLSTETGTAEFLRRAVVRIDDLVGEDDQTLSWSDRVRDAIFALPHARMAIVRSYFDAVIEARQKLTEAARAWAGGRSARPLSEDEEVLADLRRFGATDADLAGLGDLGVGDVVEVWPELAPAVEAFLAVATQWRVVAGMAGLIVTGLDYVGVRFGLRALGIRVTPELWADLQVLEIAARDALMGDR